MFASVITNWKLIGLGALALLIGGLMVALKLERAHSAKQRVQIERLNDTLRDISTKRNEQLKQSERNVDKVVKGDPVVRETVRVIREAPIPPNCATPGIETLRGAV